MRWKQSRACPHGALITKQTLSDKKKTCIFQCSNGYFPWMSPHSSFNVPKKGRSFLDLSLPLCIDLFNIHNCKTITIDFFFFCSSFHYSLTSPWAPLAFQHRNPNTHNTSVFFNCPLSKMQYEMMGPSLGRNAQNASYFYWNCGTTYLISPCRLWGPILHDTGIPCTS